MSITTTEKARETLISSLSLDRAAVVQRNNEVHELLRQGFNGYANMSNDELVECASDAGLGDNDDPEDAQAMRVLKGMDEDDEVLVCHSLNHLVPGKGGDQGVQPALRLEAKELSVPEFLRSQQMPMAEPVLKVVQDNFAGDPHREYPEHRIVVTLFNGQTGPSAEFRFESLQELACILESCKGVAAMLRWSLKSLDESLGLAILESYGQAGEAADADLIDTDDGPDEWAEGVLEEFGAQMQVDFAENPC